MASMNAKQAFDDVTPLNLSDTMRRMGINATLTEVMLRAQLRGRCDVCFQETKLTDIPFDKATKQGGKESPSLFNMVMKSIFVVLQESWMRKGYGLGLQGSQDGKDEEKVTHFIIDDNCYLVSSGRMELRVMLMQATVDSRRRGLEWKRERGDGIYGVESWRG